MFVINKIPFYHRLSLLFRLLRNRFC